MSGDLTMIGGTIIEHMKNMEVTMMISSINNERKHAPLPPAENTPGTHLGEIACRRGLCGEKLRVILPPGGDWNFAAPFHIVCWISWNWESENMRNK